MHKSPLLPPGGLGCCPFLGCGSVVVDSLFIDALNVLGALCLVLVLLFRHICLELFCYQKSSVLLYTEPLFL